MNRPLIPSLLLLLLPVRTQAQKPSLRFDDFPPTKETSVGFSPDLGGPAEDSEVDNLSLRRAETLEHKYTLLVDTGSFQRDKWGHFFFVAYVRSASGKNLQRYRVYEDPVGSFRDSISSMTFHINGPAGEDVGKINLPLHSDNSSDNVSLVLPKGMQKVSMGGPSILTLGLTNNLGMRVAFNEAKPSSGQCSNCWLSMSAKPSLNELTAGGSTSLTISLRPNTLPAFLGTLFSLNPDKAHDELLISVSSNSEQGGLPTPQEFTIPVRFTPPAPYLLLVALAGALLGGILNLLMQLSSQAAQPQAPPPQPTSSWARIKPKAGEYGVAILISLVVWVLALVLYSYTETRITVFGFGFDPSQVVPAALITFLVAGGPAVLGKIKEALGK
jgi:hypothetical protein